MSAVSTFDFVRRRGPLWQRLEDLLLSLEARHFRGMSSNEIRDLGYLYRCAASDLAYLRERDAPEDVRLVLNHLVARAHNAIYVRQRHSWRRAWLFFRDTVPRTCRRQRAAIGVAGTVFATAVLFGFAAGLADENLAGMLVGEELLRYVQSGQLWMHDVFDVLPHGYAATRIAANNITVTLIAFALGITAGLGTLYVLSLNGVIIGSVLALCANHGLLSGMLIWMAPHGVLELLALCTASGAGLLLGSALVDPGDLQRADALRQRGGDAVRMVVGMLPVLLFAGITESYVSPLDNIPWWCRVLYGLVAGGLLLAHLALSGRGDNREIQPPTHTRRG